MSRIKLTERDLAALAALATHRCLSGQQLQRLVFQCSASRVRRRLRALYDHNLVDRIVVGVQQAALKLPPFLYEVTNHGLAALADSDLPVATAPTGSTGQQLLRHRYLTNDFYITLIEATRGTPYEIRRWQHDYHLKQPARSGPPQAQRIEHPLLTRPASFLPDGFFELVISPVQSLAFFVEIDLATHPLSVWEHRARLYTAYADPATGYFEQRFGRRAFRLLIITKPDYRRRSRRNNILATLARATEHTYLFMGTTFPDITPEQVLSDTIWRQPNQTTSSLVPTIAETPRVRVREHRHSLRVSP